MSVPKSKRKQSKFEAAHRLSKLRTEVTKLASLQFGFDADRYEKSIQRYAENHKSAANVDEVVARYRRKMENFMKWFIPEERKAVIDLVREISKEFSVGNAIFPTRDNPARIEEYNARRLHMDNAIAYCYALKQNAYKSWMGNFASIMSKQQIKNMKRLYKDLFGKDVRWKKQASKSNSQTVQKSVESSTGTTTSHGRRSQKQISKTRNSSECRSTEPPWRT